MNQRPRLMPILLTAAALLATALAGCTEEPAPAAADDEARAPLLAPDGRDLKTQLQPGDEVPVPAWRLGDWWGHHVYFGAGDTEGVHYNAIIVDATAAWTLASDDPETAAHEALWDIPILGAFSKSDLSTTSFGEAWMWYDFPLSDGKTWSFPLDLRGEGPEELTATATYQDAITSSAGIFPGFAIETRLPDGTLAMAYDYVPAIGWYAHFKAYDISTEEPDDVEIRAISMGFGHDWEGTYYLTEATQIVDSLAYTLIAPPAVLAEPDPHTGFTVSAEATHVFGFGFSTSYAGAQVLAVRDPNGDHWEAVSTPAAPADQFMFDRIPAVPGEWQVVNLGAGAFSMGGLFMWELTETSGQLGAGVDPPAPGSGS